MVIADDLVTETTPLLSARAVPLSSVWKTFGNVTISVLGAGVLGMPYAFKRSGWLAGSITLTAVAVIMYFSLMLLVQARRVIESQGAGEVGTYSDLGYHAFGRAGRIAVDVLILLAQGCGCVAFLLFIGENMASAFSQPYHDHSHASSHTLLSYSSIEATHMQKRAATGTMFGLSWGDKTTYICIVFCLQVLMASINSLTRLAPFSIFGTLANIVAMAVVMRADITKIFFKGGIEPVPAFTQISGLPFVVGVGIYAFGCSPLLIPIESAMQERSKFGGVFGWAICSIDILYTAFALLGYLAFGSQTQDIITLNLQSGIESTIVKVSQCTGLFFCFRVNIDPVYELLERRVVQGKPSMVLRSILVLGIAVTAIAVPNFGDFVSLVGSSVSCTLGFILPALFHLRLFRGRLSLGKTVLDYSFIAFGVIFGAWGTISAAASILALSF
ncbi:hypothetical protein O6H91_01G110000 [Diphasiastrum complanatum]|uniref:Uncharacterized protein n=1 Tax=Diphasiastrum complanatum TaxID=34168 RepID=A0ACC2EUU8_DIPCM|nr:hypothetical protein O6H91_01G110000 [Diphasiastrum complanatum]